MVLVLATGLAMIGAGAYFLFASGLAASVALVGIFLLLAGVTITASILGVTGSTFGTIGGGKYTGKSTGRAGKDDTARSLNNH